MKQVIEFTNLKETFVEAHIADLHFGTIEPATEYKILNEQFLNYLEKMNVLDIVSINGDIFDHKFMANSDAVIYAISFVQRLINICKAKDATLILISGTASHDADQLKIFVPFINQGCDLRIVNQVQFLFIKGKKILCIPEMYNMGEAYYNTFLVRSGLYDACYMHGTFKGSIYGKDKRDLNSNREPVFDIEDFGNCKGPIISGHVHIRGTFKEDFHYSGSPLRYKFGEEEEKGFFILIHNIKERKYLLHFEPITSFRYDTINLDYMIDQDPKTIIDYLRKLSSEGIDYLRIIITKNNPRTVELLKNFYRNKNNVKIETDFEQQRIKQELNTINKDYMKYNYLFDKNLSPEQKLIQYINQEEGNDFWTVDKFINFMSYIENL